MLRRHAVLATVAAVAGLVFALTPGTPDKIAADMPADKRPTVVLCSPYIRAQETAQA